MTAYQFGYKINANSQTTYIWVLAYSQKQAWYFVKNKYGNLKNYYWVGRGLWDIHSTYFKNYHKAGQIYGNEADI